MRWTEDGSFAADLAASQAIAVIESAGGSGHSQIEEVTQHFPDFGELARADLTEPAL
jgi:hypothetical protein